MIAPTTYRSGPELRVRFGRAAQPDDDGVQGDDGIEGDILRGPGEPGTGQYAIDSYLAHHADKLARRFGANTYLRIAHAINTHDVGGGRGGIEAALAKFPGLALVAAVDSDRLYPLSRSQELADALPNCDGVNLLHSDVGHDGFLVATAALNELVAGLLARFDVSIWGHRGRLGQWQLITTDWPIHLTGVGWGGGWSSRRCALPAVGGRAPGMVPDGRGLSGLPGVAALACGVRVPEVRSRRGLAPG
jgi:hypothetical protein